MSRIFLIILFSNFLNAQDIGKTIPVEKVLERDAMIFLTSWAGINITAGASAYFMTKEPEWKYFHEMNVFWNSVNLGLGIAGLCNSLNKEKYSFDKTTRIKQIKKTETVFLVNTGLDVIYIGSGLLMKHFARNSNNTDRLNGYGNSLLLQGTFLFLFDGIEYFLFKNCRYRILENKNLTLKTEGVGLSLKVQF